MHLNYSDVENKLIQFIRDETERIGIHKGILGLSGGIDSAVVAYLTQKALGKENVLFLLMPYKSSSKESIDDALKVAKDLQVKTEKIEITPMVDAYLEKYSDSDISNLRKGNIMARMRMIVLYDLSAREKSIVIGTGNKTEILLGYSTLFGDTACAINPIGNLYKTQIRGLAKHLGVPESIILKKPTADLWKGQTDEEELGIIYETVDIFLYEKFENKKSNDELMKMGYSNDYILKIEKMIDKNKFKSKLPVIAKI